MQLQCCCSISILTAIFKEVLKRAEWAVVRSQLPRISSGAQKTGYNKGLLVAGYIRRKVLDGDSRQSYSMNIKSGGNKPDWSTALWLPESPYWLSMSKIKPRHQISKARWDGHRAQTSLQHSPGKDQGLWASTEPLCPAVVCPTNVIPDEIMKIHDSAAYSALWLSKHFSSVQIFVASLC